MVVGTDLGATVTIVAKGGVGGTLIGVCIVEGVGLDEEYVFGDDVPVKADEDTQDTDKTPMKIKRINNVSLYIAFKLL
jgi:hypothetical protein